MWKTDELNSFQFRNAKDKRRRNVSEKSAETKEKSIIETIREVNAKERRERMLRESENVKRKAAEKEKADEEYGRQLQREKIELMKMKQGVTAETEAVAAEAVEYTFGQKVGAFFYCNKGIIILAVFFIFLAVFLGYDMITKPRPDFTAMILVNDPALEACAERIEEISEEYIDDYNGNKKLLSSFYYMPLYKDADPYTLQASSTKLFALMQDGDTIMVIANDESEEYLLPDKTLVNLEELYPDNEHVKGHGFYLSGTSFAEQTGYEGEIPEDVYIGLRKVQTGARYRDKMQENYEHAKELLDNFIERFS